MSKLAHSHQPTMDELDRRRAIEDGNEDLIPDQCPCDRDRTVDPQCAAAGMCARVAG